MSERFEQIAAYLADIDIDALWQAATEVERRVLIDELIEAVDVHDDHLEVTVKGEPKLNVTLAEVGLGRRGEFQSCRRGDTTVMHTSPSYAPRFSFRNGHGVDTTPLPYCRSPRRRAMFYASRRPPVLSVAGFASEAGPAR